MKRLTLFLCIFHILTQITQSKDCECLCCRMTETSILGYAGCVPTLQSEIDVGKCSSCTVEACVSAAPTSCKLESKYVVVAECDDDSDDSEVVAIVAVLLSLFGCCICILGLHWYTNSEKAEKRESLLAYERLQNTNPQDNEYLPPEAKTNNEPYAPPTGSV